MDQVAETSRVHTTSSYRPTRGVVVAEHRRSWPRSGTVTGICRGGPSAAREVLAAGPRETADNSFAEPMVRSPRDYDDLYDADFAGSAVLGSAGWA